VFKATRVPVRFLFECLEDDYAIEEFLECFPLSGGGNRACHVLEGSNGVCSSC